jgi:hypothetical protein
MQAAILETPGRFVLEDRPVPDVGPGEVRVRAAVYAEGKGYAEYITYSLAPSRARRRTALALFALLTVSVWAEYAAAQEFAVHRRGWLWETLWNYGFIGDLGAWDYLTPNPLGLYPGFVGYTHPVGGEFNAVNSYANANMHNFRSGLWIGARDVMVPGAPPDFRPTPKPYEVYIANAQTGLYGMPSQRPPIVLRQNYLESPAYNPLLPEESAEVTFDTNLGITVTKRTYVWGFPGYRDFIVYDYTFVNTGRMVSTRVGQVVPDVAPFQQTLRDVYFAIHSGISASTKDQINFHTELTPVQAGAFGWQRESYRNYYRLSPDRTLAYSYHYNGGAGPVPTMPYPTKPGDAWRQRFGNELQSPAAFGWLALHADSRTGTPRATPAPDVLRVDNHKGGTFQGRDLDFELFTMTSRREQGFYELMSTPDLQPGLGNNGNRMAFYTLSYGPYTIPAGGTVRIVLAEIAGVMDYAAVVAGDPDGLFPQATIAAIERNAEAARRAVSWGLGATVDGVPLAAAVPPPPPAPNTNAVNASVGNEVALIAVTWDDIAETATITDASGGVFYDGRADLDGYRVYRSTDFQYTTETRPSALRGAYWTLLADLSVAEAAQYFDTELGRYRFVDEDVAFGRRYGYYVQAYNSTPRPWNAPNGTVVTDLPELVSGDYNRSEPTGAVTGPVTSFDIYVRPNPFVLGDERRMGGTGGERFNIEFRNLPERATIRLYSVAGDLVRTLRHGPDSAGNLSGMILWDQLSDSGIRVAPGVYIYHVSSDAEGVEGGGRFTGKLMIIR